MSYPVSSLLWFDRNPSYHSDTIDVQNQAPRAFTVDIEHTVRPDRLARVEICSLLVIRSLAAGVPGRARAAARLTHEGVTETICKAVLTTNGVDDKASDELRGPVIIGPGDTLGIGWGDSSGGGTCDYDCFFKIVEFDELSPLDRYLVIEPPKPSVQEPGARPDPVM